MIHWLCVLLGENRMAKLSFGYPIVLAITHTILTTKTRTIILLSPNSRLNYPMAYTNSEFNNREIPLSDSVCHHNLFFTTVVMSFSATKPLIVERSSSLAPSSVRCNASGSLLSQHLVTVELERTFTDRTLALK